MPHSRRGESQHCGDPPGAPARYHGFRCHAATSKGRPPVRSIVRFARPASAGSWVATTTSRERAMSCSVPRTRAAVCESSFDVGSSARTAPFDRSARAIEMRRRCPPERFSPQFSTCASRPPGSNSSSRSPILSAASFMRVWLRSADLARSLGQASHRLHRRRSRSRRCSLSRSLATARPAPGRGRPSGEAMSIFLPRSGRLWRRGRQAAAIP